MKYLNPEIEALSKHAHSKSLVLPTVSCGIFQDYDDNMRPKLTHQEKPESSK